VAKTRLSESWTGFFIFRIDNAGLRYRTLAVRAGIVRSQFNEHSEALYLTSSFVFENAAQAADVSATTRPGTSIRVSPIPP